MAFRDMQQVHETSPSVLITIGLDAKGVGINKLAQLSSQRTADLCK